MDDELRGGGHPQDPDFSNAPTQMGVESSHDVESPPAASADESRGQTWPGGLRRLADRYQLEEPIASGGAAIVWRAFDDVLSRSVAIKLLHPHLATDPTTVERFRLESINAARLTHPNVVSIYDTGQQGDVVYLVMEYVDGPSLRDVIRDLGPIDPTIVAALGEQVASALGEAHANGVVHRDVKPANILLTSDGVAKVTDFGIAKALSGNQATLTSPGTVVGTAAYVAPEQLEGGNVDARADVYALGVVLYECLTGKPAFQGDTPTATAAARLTNELMPPRQIRADVPRALDDVIVRATRRDASQRYADGAAMAAALTQLVHARPSDVTALLLSADGSRSETPVPEVDTGPFSSHVPATRTEYGRRLLAAFVGGLLLALIGFFATQALRDDSIVSPPSEGQAYKIVTASDFDPLGSPAREHPDQVRLAFDGDLSTAWTTEEYRQPLDQVKPGVGIWFDLGEPKDVRSILVDFAQAGESAELYAADALPDSVDGIVGWGQRIAAFDDLEKSGAALSPPNVTKARYWLIWLTSLPQTDDGAYQASVEEVRFVGP